MSAFRSPLLLRALSAEECRKAGSPNVGLFELAEDFHYQSDLLGAITVPAGYVSDFASIPGPAQWYVDNDAPCIAYGSIVHDYLYSAQGSVGGAQFTREQADKVLREAMLLCGASAMQAWVVFQAVRKFGGSHWSD